MMMMVVAVSGGARVEMEAVTVVEGSDWWSIVIWL